MFDLYLQLPQIEKQFINTFKILYKTQAQAYVYSTFLLWFCLHVVCGMQRKKSTNNKEKKPS